MCIPSKRRRRQQCNLYQSVLLIAITIIAVSSLVKSAYSTEIKWTDGDGVEGAEGRSNVPYSQNYRNKLLELEKAIMSSPNPQATLTKIAEENKMSAADLVQLIEGSKGGTPGAVSGGRGPTAVSAIFQAMTSIVLFLYKYALTKPKQFAMLTGLFYAMVHCFVSYPQNGVIVPKFVLSNGHSTIFRPPTHYLQEYVDRLSLHTAVGDEPLYSLPLEKELEDDVSLKHVLDFELGDSESAEDNAAVVKGAEASNQNMKVILHSSKEVSIPISPSQQILHPGSGSVMNSPILFSCASQAMSSHRFTEYCEDLSSASNEDNTYLSLLIQGLGDFYRYGIQSFHLLHESQTNVQDDDDDDVYTKVMVFGTLIDGHMDGFLRLTLQVSPKDDDEEEDPSTKLKVAATYFQPKPRRCRNAPKALLQKAILPQLTSSLLQTITTEYQQKLTLSKFSNNYKKQLSDSYRVKKKRQANELKELEEMVRERKKRWSNPNAGQFRPSGTRLKHPNHC